MSTRYYNVCDSESFDEQYWEKLVEKYGCSTVQWNKDKVYEDHDSAVKYLRTLARKESGRKKALAVRYRIDYAMPHKSVADLVADRAVYRDSIAKCCGSFAEVIPGADGVFCKCCTEDITSVTPIIRPNGEAVCGNCLTLLTFPKKGVMLMNNIKAYQRANASVIAKASSAEESPNGVVFWCIMLEG